MRRYLTPRMLGAHLLTVLVVAAAIGLGVWQYGVWHDKRHHHAVDLSQRTPVDLGRVIGPDEAFPPGAFSQPVVVAGTWVPDSTVYVSGREHDGRRGYWVVTSLTHGAADGPAIPVVRGWTADPAQAPAPPQGTGRLVGWLQPSEDGGGAGALADRTDARGDRIVPDLQIASLVQSVHQDLYSAYVVSADHAFAGGSAPAPVRDGTAGLAPVGLPALPGVGPFTALQNLSYAVEWWFFAGFAVFVWWRYLRDRRREWEQEALAALRGRAGTPDPAAAASAAASAPDAGSGPRREPSDGASRVEA